MYHSSVSQSKYHGRQKKNKHKIHTEKLILALIDEQLTQHCWQLKLYFMTLNFITAINVFKEINISAVFYSIA